MSWWKKAKKWTPIAGAGLGYAIGGPAGAAIGFVAGNLLSGGKGPGGVGEKEKDKVYQMSGWTPEQQQMARLMLNQASTDVPEYSNLRRQSYTNLMDLVNNYRPDIQAQVIDPMDQLYRQQREELNAQLGRNYWASSRNKILSDFDTNYNIQRAKSVADLMQQASQVQMGGYGQLLNLDPTRMYMQMLSTKPIDTAVVPGEKKTWLDLFGL